MKLKEILNKEKKEETKNIEKEEIDTIDEEISSKEVIKEESKDMSRRRKLRFKIDLPVVIFVVIILLVLGLVLYLTVGQRGNKYGTRLHGIDKISFTKKEKNKFIDSIKSNDKVNSVSIDIQGKLIYIMADFKTDVSADDAKNVINESLNSLSDAVKGFYDINALITKKDEVPTEESKIDADGNEKKVEHRVFPISGYKNNDSDHIVWESR
jgi:hypothetical protein